MAMNEFKLLSILQVF